MNPNGHGSTGTGNREHTEHRSRPESDTGTQPADRLTADGKPATAQRPEPPPQAAPQPDGRGCPTRKRAVDVPAARADRFGLRSGLAAQVRLRLTRRPCPGFQGWRASAAAGPIRCTRTAHLEFSALSRGSSGVSAPVSSSPRLCGVSSDCSREQAVAGRSSLGARRTRALRSAVLAGRCPVLARGSPRTCPIGRAWQGRSSCSPERAGTARGEDQLV